MPYTVLGSYLMPNNSGNGNIYRNKITKKAERFDSARLGIFTGFHDWDTIASTR